MHYYGITVILFSSLVLGQAPAPATGGPVKSPPLPANNSPASSVALAPDAAIITITGVCDSASPGKPSATSQSTETPAKCEMVITKAQFEALIDAINPQMPPRLKSGFARGYPQTLLFAQKARELGLENDANFQELMKYKYAQAAAQMYKQYVKDKADHISSEEVETYYKEHPQMFEQVDVVRIFVPKHKGPLPDSGVWPSGTPPEEGEMRAEAEKIHKKTVAGGDFAALEDEVYKFVGDPDNAPDVHVGKMTRDQVPDQYLKALFDLQPGQISEIVPGPQGWHVFKVLSKTTVPLRDAAPIVQRIQVKENTESLKDSIKPKFNDAYFGPLDSTDDTKSDID